MRPSAQTILKIKQTNVVLGKMLSSTLLLSSIAFVLFFQMANLAAAPKTNDSLEAIWENNQLGNNSPKNLSPQQIQQRRLQSHKTALKDKQFIQHATNVISNKAAVTIAQNPARLAQAKHAITHHQARKTPKQYTRAQYQARYKLEQELKLNRQRAAWRVKWEAQQKGKKTVSQKPAVAPANKPVIATKPLIQHPIQQTIVKRTQNVVPKQLTRAQYQWRFKQAQLKKQQAAQAHNQTSAPASKTKLSHAAFRPSKNTAAHKSLPFEIKKKLRAAKLNEYGFSAYVQDVNSPTPLLAHKDTISRVPASVMKLITSYTALGVLGPNYRWPIDVYTRGTIRNGTLQGDLIVKGYGSPEFDTKALRKLLHTIRQKGIRNLNGRVVFDNSHFNIPRQSAGAFDGKTFAAYNAQPDALLYNERISTFHVRAKGKRVHVSTSTPAHNLKIVNKMRKVRRGCRPRIGISHRGAQVVATFRGTFSSRCRTRSYSRVISKPSEMIYGSMKAMWKRDVGGSFNARYALGHAPKNAQPFIRHYSRTLAEILPTIDKDSNNVMARQLLLTIGAKYFGGQGTPRNGANAVSAWLNARGLRFPELRIENGSGLSRHARISARHIGDLLVDAYKSPYRDVLMRSLAIAGVDGTMKRRLNRTPVRGKGFFKTGTLRDVRSIAGYVKAANGRTYAISILHNDPRARSRGRSIHDKLIEWVYNGGRSNTRVASR